MMKLTIPFEELWIKKSRLFIEFTLCIDPSMTWATSYIMPAWNKY